MRTSGRFIPPQILKQKLGIHHVANHVSATQFLRFFVVPMNSVVSAAVSPTSRSFSGLLSGSNMGLDGA